mmetsp:Transcript_127171/g.231054  ORF Transcript_127171/g.231054 Transcript_127171/m.231054 type:complete len:991 (-) Transcript_127171:149-3121(-)
MRSKQVVLEAFESDKGRLPGGRVAGGLKVGALREQAVESAESSGDEWLDDNAGKNAVSQNSSYKFNSVKRAGRRLSQVRAVCGAKQRASRKSLATRYDGIITDELERFVAQVLHSSNLMRKSAALQVQFHKPLLGSVGKQGDSAAPPDGTFILSQVMQVMHKIKVFTVHTCWYDHVRPAREEAVHFQLRYDALKGQFQDARQAYLREVTMLRDELRAHRDNPETKLPMSTDISFYFDVDCLMISESEKKFLLDAATEKLKMVMQKNPDLTHGVDLSQLDRLHSKIESRQVQDLRKELKRVGDELNAQLAKNDQHNSVPDVPVHGRRPVTMPTRQGQVRDHQLEELTAHVVTALEHQVDELQTNLWREKKAHAACQESTKQLEAEREDLANSLQEEVCLRIFSQEEVSRLKMQISTLGQQLQAASRAHGLLQKQLKVREADVQRLEHALQNPKHLRKVKHHQKQKVPAEQPAEEKRRVSQINIHQPRGHSILHSSPPNPRPVSGRRGSATARQPAVEHQSKNQDKPAAAEVGELFHPEAAEGSAANGGTSSHRLSHEEELLEQYEAWVLEFQNQAREESTAREELARTNADLQIRCDHLAELLQEHVNNLIAMDSEDFVDEAENLDDTVNALGCKSGSNLQACACGALFGSDQEAFCIECGLPQLPKAMDAGQPVEELARELNTLESEHDQAVLQLHDVLGERAKEQSGLHDQQSVLKIFDLQQNAEELRHQRDLVEAQILAKHAEEAILETESRCTLAWLDDADEEGGAADADERGAALLEENEAERKFVAKLQSLCAAMAGKLRASALDAASLFQALGKIRVALQTGSEAAQDHQSVKTLDLDSKFLLLMQALREAQRHATVSPHHHGKDGKRWKTQRKAKLQHLLEKSSRVLHMVASSQPMAVESILDDIGRTFNTESTPEKTPEVKQLPPLQDGKRMPKSDVKTGTSHPHAKKTLPPLSVDQASTHSPLPSARRHPSHGKAGRGTVC